MITGFRCHIFDLDYTLIRHNTSYAFCRFLCDRGILPKKALFEALLARLQLKTFKKSLDQIHFALFTKVLKGLEISLLESHVEDFLDQFFWDSVYPPAYAIFKRQQHLGATVALMSSSPAFLVEKISNRLSVDHWEATEYEVDQLGKLQSVKRFLDGAAKAQQGVRLLSQKGYASSECTAYSDSYYDLPFLLSVGKAVAVNPDRKLRFFARKHDWEIL